MRNHRSAVAFLIAFAESAVETLSVLPYVARKQSCPLVLFLLIFVTACSMTFGNTGGTTGSDNVNGSWSVVSAVHYNSAKGQTTAQFYLANSEVTSLVKSTLSNGSFVQEYRSGKRSMQARGEVTQLHVRKVRRNQVQQ